MDREWIHIRQDSTDINYYEIWKCKNSKKIGLMGYVRGIKHAQDIQKLLQNRMDSQYAKLAG